MIDELYGFCNVRHEKGCGKAAKIRKTGKFLGQPVLQHEALYISTPSLPKNQNANGRKDCDSILITLYLCLIHRQVLVWAFLEISINPYLSPNLARWRWGASCWTELIAPWPAWQAGLRSPLAYAPLTLGVQAHSALPAQLYFFFFSLSGCWVSELRSPYLPTGDLSFIWVYLIKFIRVCLKIFGIDNYFWFF